MNPGKYTKIILQFVSVIRADVSLLSGSISPISKPEPLPMVMRK